MLRGTLIFICDNCGHNFKALDIEYNCTTLSAPQKCPKCGSYHTMPMEADDDFNLFDRTIYEDIWRHQDRTSNHDVIYYAPGDKLANSIKECEEWNAQDCK